MKVKKLKVKKIYIAIISMCIFTIIMIIFFTTRNIVMQKKLSEEVEILSTMNIMNDVYEVKLYTKGNYKKVERAIKTYLRDYSNSLQAVLNILNDEKLKKVLSASNYEQDGKEFTVTLGYLEKTKIDFNDNMNTLIKLSKKNEIMKYIEKEELGKYYNNLYKNYMFDDGIETNIKNSKLQLETTTNSINNLINTDIEVINLLKQNKDSWTIENDTIVFYQEDLLNKYNELVGKVK